MNSGHRLWASLPEFWESGTLFHLPSVSVSSLQIHCSWDLHREHKYAIGFKNFYSADSDINTAINIIKHFKKTLFNSLRLFKGDRLDNVELQRSRKSTENVLGTMWESVLQILSSIDYAIIIWKL